MFAGWEGDVDGDETEEEKEDMHVRMHRRDADIYI